MPLKIGFVMDDINVINTKKDTSFAMMLEAQRRGHEVYYMLIEDLSINNGQPLALATQISVTDTSENFYQVVTRKDITLDSLDAILMRKDPPFDSQFLYATQILELAENKGTVVVNKPSALRDFNEKLFTSLYPEYIPDTLVSADKKQIKAFQALHGDIICKPLDGMGGTSIYRIKQDGLNLGVITEVLTDNGKQHAMFQRYMPQIVDGDKRILLIDGEVVPYCLARLPAQNETRGNLAAGGSGRPQEVTDEELQIAQAIANDMPSRGIIFVGLDMIGDKVTEINITSPTCVREIEAAYPINICGKLFDAIEKRVAQ
ncbi:glutathione synthase [Agaribacter marinus]|uniref:Glutathione synthetase n=1 Tax=Agaribacter marinus TaxID=1431249 RepID=A0AA37WK57_9ALTE|nr:glutathione synthase [Agaribacter marinus]GLR71104.1 glutathione synthetase [Agaribacter marinus]